jgi:hypothetical protein
MYRLAYIIVCSIFLNLCYSSTSPAAWSWGGGDNLLAINGVSYTSGDFKHWWEIWQDDKSRFPEDLEQFIEWKLLVQEARSMELDGEPNYLRKIKTFYKARTRMMLKYDAIDSKLEISDKEIKERYLADYTPIFNLSLLYFSTEEKAKTAYNGIINKEYTFDDLKPKGDGEEQPLFKEMKSTPNKLSKVPGLQDVLEQLSVGQVSMPQQIGNYFALFRLDEILMPDENEFTIKRKNIKATLYKEKQSALTDALIKDLWKRYEVQVDEELLAMVTKNPNEEMLSRPLVFTNRENMPLLPVVEDYRRDLNSRKNKDATEEERAERARGFMSGMIIENLLHWEAEERRYEEKAPFKWTYEFYQENSLIKELESRLIAAQVSVSDADVSGYYQEHPDEFRPPERISVIALQGEMDTINNVVTEINQGLDFIQAGKKNNLTPIPILDTPTSELKPGLEAAIRELDIDGVSKSFEINNVFYVVKLQKREIQEPLPLEKFKGEISAKLKKKKYSDLRREYIEMLLKQSDVQVNSKVWKKLQAEYTN